MYQFNRKADLDVLKELCKNRNLAFWKGNIFATQMT